MAKSINLKLALKDQFSAPLKRATKNTKSIDRTIKRASRSVRKFGNSTKLAMKKAAKATAVGVGAIGASMGVFAKQSIDAAKTQIEQETKLQAVLMNTKGMRKDQIEGIKRYAGELQSLGVIGDEVALAGVQQLGSYQLQADTLKKLMPGMNDLLVQQKGLNAATGDAVNIGNMIGKVMTGQVGALSRAGINFSKAQEKVLKFGTEQEKAAILAEVLKQNVGGVNKAMAETDQGKIQQAKNAFGDMQEEVGKKLLPHLASFSTIIYKNIPRIQDFILKLMDKTAGAIKRVRPYVSQLKEDLGKIFDKVKPALKVFVKLTADTFKRVGKTVNFLIKNFDRLSPIIYTVVGAMAAYKTVMAISKGITVAMAVASKVKAAWDVFGAAKLNILTLAQWAYNAALTANPIGLVIAGVAALTAVVWTAYKNWDLIKKKVSEFWKALDNNPVGRVIKDLVKFLNPLERINKAIETTKRVIGGVKNVWNKITGKTPKEEGEKPPRHALGTSYFAGGATGINEGGRGETAILPGGTQIISHEQGKRANNSNKIEVVINIQGNVIGNKQFMEQVGNFVGTKVLTALKDM